MPPVRKRRSRPSLDDMELGKKIGRGSFGTIYTGQGAQAELAIKVEVLDSKASLASFRRELVVGRMLAPSKCPYICAAMFGNASHNTTRPFLAMELQGASLQQYLARADHHKLNPDTFVHCIATALALLHGLGITHVDLSPSNVLLRRGLHTVDMHTKLFSCEVAICDFGTAKVPGTSIECQATTISVRAPRVLLDDLDYGPDVDIFAFGVLLAMVLEDSHTTFIWTDVVARAEDQEMAALQRISRFVHLPEACPKVLPVYQQRTTRRYNELYRYSTAFLFKLPLLSEPVDPRIQSVLDACVQFYPLVTAQEILQIMQ